MADLPSDHDLGHHHQHDAGLSSQLFDVLDEIHNFRETHTLTDSVSEMFNTMEMVVLRHRQLERLPPEERPQDELRNMSERVVEIARDFIVQHGHSDHPEYQPTINKIKDIIKKTAEETCSMEHSHFVTSQLDMAGQLELPFYTHEDIALPALGADGAVLGALTIPGDDLPPEDEPTTKKKKSRKRKAADALGDEAASEQEPKVKRKKTKKYTSNSTLNFSNPMKPTTDTSVLDAVRFSIGEFSAVPDKSPYVQLVARFQHGRKQVVWEMVNTDNAADSMKFCVAYQDIESISMNLYPDDPTLVRLLVVLREDHLTPEFYTVKNNNKTSNNKPWTKIDDPTPNQTVSNALQHTIFIKQSLFTTKDGQLSAYETFILSDPYIRSIALADASFPRVGEGVFVLGLQTMENLKMGFLAFLARMEDLIRERGFREFYHCLNMNLTHKFKWRRNGKLEHSFGFHLEDWFDLMRAAGHELTISKEEFHYLVMILRIGENGICMFKHKSASTRRPKHKGWQIINSATSAVSQVDMHPLNIVNGAGMNPPEMPVVPAPEIPLPPENVKMQRAGRGGNSQRPVTLAGTAKKGKDAKPVRVAVHISKEALYRVFADEPVSEFWKNSEDTAGLML